MNNFIIIFICMIAGINCRRLKNFPVNSAQVLNSFIIFISFPALVLAHVPKLLSTMSFSGLWWLPVSMAWLTFIFSYFFFSLIGKKLNWSHAKIGALILTAGLGNTSFVGFPLLEALIGPHAIPIGVLVDQPGSFLTLSTFGIMTASILSGEKVTTSFIAKRVFSFPPFLAILFSILWAIVNLPGESIFLPVFEKISQTLVPLALFAVGLQLKFDLVLLKRRWRGLALGLTFKLILMPFVFSILYMKILHGNDLITQVIVLESAMASMITSAIVATEFHLDSEMANLMVGISIPISLISVPLWNYFLFN